MISVCSTIYREPEAFEIFVRSLLGNASKPDEIEIVIVHDESDTNPEITETFIRLQNEFPQLKKIDRTKKMRIDDFNENIEFYNANHIFEGKYITDMREQIARYESGELTFLWYPPGINFNTAINMAHGDLFYIGPCDYLVCFDISKIGDVVLQLGAFAGRFDWYDFTSLDPYPDMLEDLRNKGNIPDQTTSWLQQAQEQHLLWLPNQHGVRFIDKDTLRRAGKFDDRWFIRAFSDDQFNLAASVYAPGIGMTSAYRIMDHELLQNSKAFVGPVRRNKPENYHYLSSLYDGTPEIHNKLKADIQYYLSNGGGLYEN